MDLIRLLGLVGYKINKAVIIIRFFIMYCPTKVRVKKDSLKERSGNKISGKNVQAICAKVNIIIF